MANEKGTGQTEAVCSNANSDVVWWIARMASLWEIRSSLEWDAVEGESPVGVTQREVGQFLSTVYWILGRKLGATNIQP